MSKKIARDAFFLIKMYNFAYLSHKKDCSTQLQLTFDDKIPTKFDDIQQNLYKYEETLFDFQCVGITAGITRFGTKTAMQWCEALIKDRTERENEQSRREKKDSGLANSQNGNDAVV